MESLSFYWNRIIYRLRGRGRSTASSPCALLRRAGDNIHQHRGDDVVLDVPGASSTGEFCERLAEVKPSAARAEVAKLINTINGIGQHLRNEFYEKVREDREKWLLELPIHWRGGRPTFNGMGALVNDLEATTASWGARWSTGKPLVSCPPMPALTGQGRGCS